MNKSDPCWWGLCVYMNFLLPEEMFLKRGKIIISSRHQHTFLRITSQEKLDIQDIYFLIFVWGVWSVRCLAEVIYLCNVWWCYLIVLIFYLIISAFVLHACKISGKGEGLIIKIEMYCKICVPYDMPSPVHETEVLFCLMLTGLPDGKLLNSS